MNRLPELNAGSMTAAQRAVYEEIVSGPHARVVGPFRAWLQIPELARRARALSEHIRFHSSLPPKLMELAILITGRHWKAEFEFHAHAQLARKAGLDEAIIAALARGQRPTFADDREALVHALCTELYETRRVADATYTRALEALGLPAVVELVATIGYYCMVSLTLNAFQVPLPPGEPSPFAD